ncbi:MAG: ABC transporter ATP-binding protein [Oscillospiraceae bacterium]|nr:ABC transporter ATP-binding protein [Oscillospiraceae bacterium]
MDGRLIIQLEDIEVVYGAAKVLRGINLNIHDKEFLTLLGPSGCGKTTTLRIIGGFTQPKTGNVYFDGEKINGVPPHLRQVNTIFQRYALFPHLNVYENVAFGLRLKKAKESEVRAKVAEMLELVNLSGFQARDVNSLSGGQQQRVAIARALINHPRVLLLDEPLGALDLQLRKEMQTELKKIQQRLDITFIYVTHDQEEALTMSDTIVVMNNGEIQQIGTPEDVYNEPSNAFVAKFIGASNIIDGVMHKDFFLEFGGNYFACVDKGFKKMERVDVVIRPEDIILEPPSDKNIIGTVETVTFKGVHYEMTVDSFGYKWIVHSTAALEEGAVTGMNVSPQDIHTMKKTDEDNEPYEIEDITRMMEDGEEAEEVDINDI